ncbi:MAG: SDR family NAD(P)-dependent oxidoreductase [Hyphomicrobiales bacterium]|nr:SDR family NAD(P)-dependent oxidoreductase [Hyphomicrobiales bacterium]
MIMDIVMIMISVPLSLLLSNSYLSFDPLSWYGMGGWISIGIAGHFLFRLSGLYRMMWRFASTPDFYNIVKNCTILTIGLYCTTLIIRSVQPVTGLNEREFIIFFFVTFTFISTPRLLYRYLREGSSWFYGNDDGSGKERKRALFLGSLEEADVIISYARSNIYDLTRIIGIMTNDPRGTVGTNIQGVPVVSQAYRASQALDEYFKDTEGLDIVIFGHQADKTFPYFSELVRIARRGGAAVEQFAGLSNLRRSGKLTLEKVEMETILRRSTVPSDYDRLSAFMKQKRVFVTGGAGSIGRVLVRRALDLGAEAVLVADISEFNIFNLQAGYIAENDMPRVTLRILDIRDERQLSSAVKAFRPDIIFHAAALKHVPLLEENWDAAIKTNVFGTLNCAKVAVECEVPEFVLISSDKAADPRSILGLTKLMAEYITSAMHFRNAAGAHRSPTNLMGVRFGNVFGSDGSVSTIFQAQIDAGGPVTVTDPLMTRYLMTIGEAVDLVIVAATVSSADDYAATLGIYMLDMGEAVSILTVAENMIRLSGKRPYQDIEIVITGKRPGEKLHESLCAPSEEMVDVGVPNIFGLHTRAVAWEEVQLVLDKLDIALRDSDKQRALTVMEEFCSPEKQLHSTDAPKAVEKGQDHTGPERMARPGSLEAWSSPAGVAPKTR